jgi:CHAD domain-containing protein
MIENESVVTYDLPADTQSDEAVAAPAEKKGVRAPTPGNGLPKIVIEQLSALQQQQRAVLSDGSVEAIHKMRVATRRLQSSLDLLQVKSDHLKTTKLKRRLRDWRRKLSTVRNCDVFLDLIRIEAVSRKAGRGEQFVTLVSILEKKRGERIAEVQEYLKRADIPKFAARLGITLRPLPEITQVVEGEDEAAPSEQATIEVETGKLQGEVAPPDLKKWPDEGKIALRTADRIDQRLAEFQALAAQAHATTHPQELHELRIAAKRLRYLLEVVSDQGYGDASRALASLRSIQDRIGDWHDLEALEDEIIGTVSRRKFLKKHLSESAHMLLAAAHIEKKKSALMTRLFPIRVARSVPATSQRLARALRRSTLPPAAQDDSQSREDGEE